MTVVPRFCPNCGAHTAEDYCAADGVATFELKTGDPEAAKLDPGALVAGKYRILRQLGRGGFGAVYEVEHTGGLGRMALKLLSLEQQDEDDIRRFYREAQVTAQLRHANTVRVFDVGQVHGGALFLAMELLRGKSLEEELKERGKVDRVMGQTEAIDMACDVLRSLSEAHSSGLVHRDLKPANLMRTEVDGELMTKVLDFGIAHVQDSSLTGTGRALGTPMYMSPEQCTGGPIDARSDLYSLGVILYRCVTGKVPFGDPNPLTIMFAHISQPPPDLYASARTPVNDAFAVALNRALAKAPDERFATAREMRAALETAKSAPLIDLPDMSGDTGDYLPRRAETPPIPAGTPPTRGLPSPQVAAQAAKSLGLQMDTPARTADQPQAPRLVVTVDGPGSSATTEADMTLEAMTVADTPARAPDSQATAGSALRPASATSPRPATSVAHDRIATAVVESLPTLSTPGGLAAIAETAPKPGFPFWTWGVAAAVAVILAIGWGARRADSAVDSAQPGAPMAANKGGVAAPSPVAADVPAPVAVPVAVRSPAPATSPAAGPAALPAAISPAAVEPAAPTAGPASRPAAPAPRLAAPAPAPRQKARRDQDKTAPAKRPSALDDALPTD